jgi:hypothetical protein
MEAPSRIELLHKGFADLSLTTWARRHDERLRKMERETRFELATTCLGSKCSTTELLPQHFSHYSRAAGLCQGLGAL